MSAARGAKAFRQIMSQAPEQWSKQERDLIARAGLSERVRAEPPRRKKAG
jgi:hypothetical protein